LQLLDYKGNDRFTLNDRKFANWVTAVVYCRDIPEACGTVEAVRTTVSSSAVLLNNKDHRG
jgi:hypothetical protein